MKKILLLGSGELGKEFVISAQRKGQYIIACDSYAGAPAMQVADECEVFSMLDGDALERVVRKHQPDIIVPEIEAIRTERLYGFEKEGIQVVPSARAVNFTMNRKAIRDLAAQELGLKTAKYFYAKSFDELKAASEKIGFPCVVKPLMSSSGKGQSLVKSADELEHAWEYGCNGSRGDMNSPVLVGGGRVFGPKPRDYYFKLNKKVKALARKSALAYKAQNNAIIVVEDFNFEAPKTKDFVVMTKKLKVSDKKLLVVLPEANKNVYLSARNVKGANVQTISGLNTYRVLDAGVVVFAESALSAIDNILM